MYINKSWYIVPVGQAWISSLILLRSLRMYVLIQLFFSIWVNSGFINLFIRGSVYNKISHYSPRNKPLFADHPPPPAPSFPYLKVRIRHWEVHIFYFQSERVSSVCFILSIIKHTFSTNQSARYIWTLLLKCKAKQNRTDYAYKTTSRYNTSRLVRISLLIIAINCNFFSGKLAL